MALLEFSFSGQHPKRRQWPVKPEVAAFLKQTNRKHVAQDALQDIFLEEIVHCIGTTDRFFVEFGFNAPDFEGGSGANTAALYLQGWRGLLLDGNSRNATINLHPHFLFQSNIARLFRRYSVPTEFDYLSVDMDSHDLFVLRSIFKAGFRPRMVQTEFNPNYWGRPIAISQLDPTLATNSLPTDYKFVYQRCAWGASSYAFELLAREFGYTLVALSLGHGSDLYFLRDDLIGPSVKKPTRSQLFRHAGRIMARIPKRSIDGDPLQIRSPPGSGRNDYVWHGPGFNRGEKILDLMIDYETFQRTGDVQASVTAAAGSLRRNMSDSPCWKGLFS
jgi:hypothetical protein